MKKDANAFIDDWKIQFVEYDFYSNNIWNNFIKSLL